MIPRDDGGEGEVADPDQRVPVCADCKQALGSSRPDMPKFALANDFWIGKLPACLANLSKGARLLLPLVRGLIRRYNCSFDSKAFVAVDQRIKGYVGNTVAYPQGDGGAAIASLPPSAEEMAKYLVIAFVGSDEDLERAYV